MTFLKLLFIAVCGLVVGTAGLSATMAWPDMEAMFASILFSPLLALGGWFMFFLILPLVAIMWAIRTPRIVQSPWLFLAIGAVVGTGIGAVFTGGSEPRWRFAFAVGGCLAGAISNAMIVLLKSTAAKDAPPNDGWAKRPDGSQAGGGTPSAN